MSVRACQECTSAVEQDYIVQIQATYTLLNRTTVEVAAPPYFSDVSIVPLSVASPPKGNNAKISISVTMGSLLDSRVRVLRPIPVTLTLEENIWTAEQTQFSICATGDSPEDAQLSLAEYIGEDFAHWVRVPEAQLSEDAKKLLAQYRAYIEVLN